MKKNKNRLERNVLPGFEHMNNKINIFARESRLRKLLKNQTLEDVTSPRHKDDYFSFEI